MRDKYNAEEKKNVKTISAHAVFAFIIAFSLSMLLIFIIILNRSSVEKLKMEQLILEKSVKINESMSRLLYKTQVLSSVILQNNGEVENFEQMAATIVDDPSILNILIAPDGIVTYVYPLEGNSSVLGHNFFEEGAGNKEAILAKETGQLVLGGPFDAKQGGQILVGRAPVFIDGPEGDKQFWGLVSVTLKFPDALRGVGLDELVIQGFAYELWRINPDTTEKQVISSSGHNYDKYTNYVERKLTILNADWYLRILPVREWYQFPETWTSLFVCLCVSLLFAVVVQSNRDLKVLKCSVEVLSNTDALTGIYNRRYFFEAVRKETDRANRQNSNSFIIMIDLDNFKSINDKYGHQAGDTALKTIAESIQGMLRSYDILARYGGEEFIIFITDIDKENAVNIAERMRSAISDMLIDVGCAMVTVTSSFGVAPASPLNDLDTAINLADKALYRAKNEGRNRVQYCDTVSM